MKTLIILAIAAFISTSIAQNKETIQFKSSDGLELTADVYITNSDKSTPFIVLFHQAGWSRGEYLEIAPRLNKMGFNVMAVDQRSGGAINGVENESFKLAQKAKLATTYADAYPDIGAAVEWARANYAQGQLLIWGSSYSSALVLKYAGDNPKAIDGVISFSPGEYFASYGKTDHWIVDSAVNIAVPSFISSAKSERSNWQPLYDAIKSDKAFYLPQTSGNHGSRALWSKFDDSEGYWQALSIFLDEYFPRVNY